MPQPSTSHEIDEIRQRLNELEAERKQLRQRLHEIEATSTTSATVTATSSPYDKVNLFRGLFRGRNDVLPRRWQNPKTGKKGFSPVCRNEWVPGVCQKPQVKCSDCPHQAFVPVDDDIIAQHLRGTPGSGSDRGDEFVIGVYPILPDNGCWFLAVDFDGKTWESDAKSYLDSCRAHQIEAALERFRSCGSRKVMQPLEGRSDVAFGQQETRSPSLALDHRFPAHLEAAC